MSAETSDQLHARLTREQQTIAKLRETATTYETMAERWETQARSNLAKDPLESRRLGLFPDALQERAAEHRAWAAERRERADAMSASLQAEWKANPDLRPSWAPRTTMADEVRAHEARTQLRERAGQQERPTVADRMGDADTRSRDDRDRRGRDRERER